MAAPVAAVTTPDTVGVGVGPLLSPHAATTIDVTNAIARVAVHVETRVRIVVAGDAVMCRGSLIFSTCMTFRASTGDRERSLRAAPTTGGPASRSRTRELPPTLTARPSLEIGASRRPGGKRAHRHGVVRPP